MNEQKIGFFKRAVFWTSKP